MSLHINSNRLVRSAVSSVFVVVILAFALINIHHTWAATATFTPTDDAYVDSSQVTSVFGTSTQVRVDGSPTVHGYLKFNVQGINGSVTKATFRIFAKSSQATGFRLFSVTNSSWGEKTMNWNTAPPFAATATASSGPVTTGTWYSLNVTPLIATNGVVSFGLDTTNSTALALASKESGSATAPQLVVETADAADTIPPSVPAGLTAAATNTSSVRLSWSASTDNVGVAGYTIYKNGFQIGTTTSTSFNDSNVQPSTSYMFTVDAFDAAGNHSAQSAAASVTTPAPPDTTPPSVPAGLGASAISQSQVNLSWTASTDDVGVKGYTVYRNGLQIATSATNSFSDTTVQPGTTYSYTVDAFDAAGNHSAQSVAASVTTPALADTTPPTVPANLAATSADISSITIGWTASTDNVGVAGYTIFRNGTQIATTTNTSYMDSGLAPNTTYSYTVDAFDSAGNHSAQSAAVSAATLADTSPPSIPLNLAGTAVSEIQINLSWSAATDNVGVAGYTIYRNGLQLATTPTTMYSDQGLQASTSYLYNVDAYDGAGNHSAQSTAISVVTPDTTPPSVPIGLAATSPSQSEIDLTWSAATDNVGIAGYSVYRDGTKIATLLASTLSYADASLTPSSTHSYSVDAFDAANNHSAQSAAATATTAAVPPDTAPPSVPANLTATSTGITNISLSWNVSTDNVGVTGYSVYRNGVKIATTATNSYNDTGLSPSTDYSYTVDAYDGAVNHSAQSLPFGDTTMADTQTPTTPANLTATAANIGQVQLSWNVSSDNIGVAGYTVYRGGNLIGTTAAASYTDITVQAGTTYSYTIDAYDAAGNHSAQSTAVTITTLTPQTSFTFAPTDDTYVESDTATTNYGSSSSFYEDGSPFKHTFLKFSVSGVSGPVQSAKIRIFCKSDPSVFGGEFHRVADNSWAEKVITWNTAPAMDAAVLGSLGAVNTGSWYEVSVAATVTGNGVYSYEIVSANADGANYASKESGAATAPQLVVNTASATADTTAPTVQVTNPPNGSTVSGAGVTVSANASDNVGIASVQFKLDGNNLGSPITTSPYSLNWDSATAANGPHTMTATAVDTSGNATTSAAASFSVSNVQTGPCSLLSTPPAAYNHVIWIWFENKSYSNIFGSGATNTTYEKSLQAKCGSSTNYLDNVTPSTQSSPNYLAATSGSNCVTGLDVNGTGCIIDDNPPSAHTLPTTSLFQLTTQAGKTWKSYEESMPSNCTLSSSSPYVVRHNPAAFYSNISADCQAFDVPFPGISCSGTGCTTPSSGPLLDDVNNGTLPNFSFITPGLCNDTHDCDTGIGDQWLQTWLPKIFAGPNYQSGDTAVFVMWDEGTAGSPIPNLFITPYTTPSISTVTVDHFAVLRTTEDMLGISNLGYLGCASGLQPGTSTACPDGWNADLRSLFHM